MEHLDIHVDDLDAAGRVHLRKVRACDYQPQQDVRVLFDQIDTRSVSLRRLRQSGRRSPSKVIKDYETGPATRQRAVRVFLGSEPQVERA